MSRPVAFMSPRSPAELRRKREALEALLGGLGRTLVAYSGGVDSAFLLSEVHRVRGRGAALGVIARSPSLPARELDSALALADRRGLEVRVIETHEMERAPYRANGPDRCFHCKSELFDVLSRLARSERWATIAFGAVTDDLNDVRPGMGAARDRGIRAPLLEVGLAKSEVRMLARSEGLEVWDKPQAACLASRIPHGSAVTPEKLAQVERSEEWLRGRFGLRVVRVRHHGAAARVETVPPQVGMLLDPPNLEAIQKQFSKLGFESVVVDPNGYRRPDPIPD